MNHCIFQGDEVELAANVTIEIDYGQDWTGLIHDATVQLRTGDTLTFDERDDDGYFNFRCNEHDVTGDHLVDMPVRLKPDEFTHDHGVCEDVYDEHQLEAVEWQDS